QHKSQKSGREKPKPNKKTNQPNTHHNECLIWLANPKITIQRKITTTPNPTGQNKGGSQTTKNDSRNSTMHTKQINLIIYNRAPKGPIRHTPHQPNT
ncbi:TPA: hypothetical protein ACGIZV_001915, partial [Corynebacterium striatum]